MYHCISQHIKHTKFSVMGKKTALAPVYTYIVQIIISWQIMKSYCMESGSREGTNVPAKFPLDVRTLSICDHGALCKRNKYFLFTVSQCCHQKTGHSNTYSLFSENSLDWMRLETYPSVLQRTASMDTSSHCYAVIKS